MILIGCKYIYFRNRIGFMSTVVSLKFIRSVSVSFPRRKLIRLWGGK